MESYQLFVPLMTRSRHRLARHRERLQPNPHLSKLEAIKLAVDASPPSQDRSRGRHWCGSAVYPTRWRHRGSVGGTCVRRGRGCKGSRKLAYANTRADDSDDTDGESHDIRTRGLVASVTTAVRGLTLKLAAKESNKSLRRSRKQFNRACVSFSLRRGRSEPRRRLPNDHATRGDLSDCRLVRRAPRDSCEELPRRRRLHQ
jgi:hypothetical protein